MFASYSLCVRGHHDDRLFLSGVGLDYVVIPNAVLISLPFQEVQQIECAKHLEHHHYQEDADVLFHELCLLLKKRRTISEIQCVTSVNSISGFFEKFRVLIQKFKVQTLKFRVHTLKFRVGTLK